MWRTACAHHARGVHAVGGGSASRLVTIHQHSLRRVEEADRSRTGSYSPVIWNPLQRFKESLRPRIAPPVSRAVCRITSPSRGLKSRWHIAAWLPLATLCSSSPS